MDAVSEAAEIVARFFPLDPHHQESRIAELLELVSPGLDARHLAIGQVPKLWQHFLDFETERRTNQADIERIALLGWFEMRCSKDNDDLRIGFRNSGMNQERSLLEMRLRLASRLFIHGRKIGQGETERAQRAAILPWVIYYFDQAQPVAERALKEGRQKALFGIRGVSRLFLAREEDNPTHSLQLAAADLEISGRLGDESEEHNEYLREAYRKLYDQDRDPRWLARLDELLEAARNRDMQYYFELSYVRTMRALQSDDAGYRRAMLDESIALIDEHLLAPAQIAASPPVYFAARGFSKLMAYESRHELDDNNTQELLDSAVTDLRIAAKSGMSHGALAEALIIKSYGVRKEDPRAGMAILAEASLEAKKIPVASVSQKYLVRAEQGKLDCRLRLAIAAADCEETKALCRERMSLNDSAVSIDLSFLMGAKLLAEQDRDLDCKKVAGEVAQFCASVLVDQEINAAQRAFLGSHLAGLFWRLGDQARAFEVYLALIESIPDELSPLVWAFAANVSLGLAKEAIDSDKSAEARSLLLDGANWYEKALARAATPGVVEEAFLPVVVHSKLGETYVRLQALTNDTAHGRAAILNLGASLALGNDAPELHGLLADAHYRIGLAERSMRQLSRALELKTKARSVGHVSRENWSVSASIYHKLFVHEGDPDHLAKAIDSAVCAFSHDQSWPWPLLQLSEFIGAQEEHKLAMNFSAHTWLEEIPAALRRPELQARGVKLAIENTEFKTRVLGGRTDVYVLDDPHGLISTSIVLKPTWLRNAQTEERNSREFLRYLRANNLHEKFELPRAISIIPFDAVDTVNATERAKNRADVVFAMERASGPRLGDVLYGHAVAGRDHEVNLELRGATEFLAAYHAWGESRRRNQKFAKSGAFEVERILEQQKLPADQFGELIRSAEACFLGAIRQMTKKDAHPENWIVSGRRLMMIDLESSADLPVLFELAQLAEDYGCIPVTQAGWSTRIELAEFYLASLNGLGCPVSLRRQDIETLYAFFWALRCLFGFAYFRKQIGASPSSALERMASRYDHWQRSTKFLMGEMQAPAIRKFAAQLDGLGSKWRPSRLSKPNL